MAQERSKDAGRPKDVCQEPSTEEQESLRAKYLKKLKTKPPTLKKSVDESGVNGLTFGRDRSVPPQLAELFGSADKNFQRHMINQILGAFPGVLPRNGDDPTESDCDAMANAGNTAMAIIGAAEPRNGLEAMLVVQMIAAHNMAMTFAKRALLPHRERAPMRFYMEMANKMLRTYACQLETLKRYREGGQQKVVVEHVHVNRGGKAIVGAVQATAKKDEQRAD